MAEFEDDDIDKIFKEIISSDDIDEIDSERLDAIISIEKVSPNSLLKELIFVTQSLSQSIVHINELMLDAISTTDYVLNEELRDIIGSMYKLSEDLDEYMIDLFIEESNLNEEDEQGE